MGKEESSGVRPTQLTQSDMFILFYSGVKLKLLYDPFLTPDSGVKQAIRISEADMDAESQLLKISFKFCPGL